MKYQLTCLATIVLSLGMSCSQQKWTEQPKDNYNLLENPGGQTLGYVPESGVSILEDQGLAFKDLNKNGKLDPYEDWRLPYEERAKDLAARLSIEEIAGLMLYSAHQAIPTRNAGPRGGTYDGKPYEEGVTDPSEPTDQQKKFLDEDNLRHVLVTNVQSPAVAAKWSNKVQAFCESVGNGIPANNSSDPRHGTIARAEFDVAAEGDISMWPNSLGMAATFDPALVRQFGAIASIEYRAMGISTALSPQVDMATEPRWLRFSGTFGESPLLSAAMAKAYCDGFQTSAGDKEIASGWGFQSVNAMVKHWPGGGSGEGGRDAHYGFGKYAVYPGKNFDEHLIPFTQGAFDLEGPTNMAAAVMPYYTISWGQDKENGENVGNSYSKYMITDLLREKYNYDGVVCTDWGVTADHNVMDLFIDGHSWGAETISEEERHFRLLMAGVDQFGGNNKAQPIIDAYQMGIEKIGEEKMRARMEQSAVRLLRNIFRAGLFENPYLDVEETKATVGKPAFMQAGYEAQLKSVVMLKNQEGVLPLAEKTKVYVPQRYVPASRNIIGMEIPARTEYPVDLEMLAEYFEVTVEPEEADVALVFIESPRGMLGYDKADVAKGGNGYLPISLQYEPYTATEARASSIAGGDPLEDFTNRSYQGKTVTTPNVTDAELVAATKAKMQGKPVIVSVNVANPMVFSEVEPMAKAILVNFNVQDQAVFDLLSGKAEPSGLLPAQMPANMTTVEKQAEDVPFDMEPYEDSAGNRYDFGFGMNWSGILPDDRATPYRQRLLQ
ncbi:MAG TPA: glycoside hydrolase family 3 protein [Saprospiraceae bacterium]|nr:glycoside hydrolase family 3 protein [Saprospiraceae bacterium]